MTTDTGVQYSITHKAVVRSVSGLTAVATIAEAGSASCGGCALVAVCRPRGGADKADADAEVTVALRYPGEVSPGQTVTIGLASRLQWSAVALALGVPCLLMIGVLLGCLYAGMSQAMAAMAAIGSCCVWGMVLAAFRRRISRSFSWEVAP